MLSENTALRNCEPFIIFSYTANTEDILVLQFLRRLSSSPCLQCTHHQLRDAGVSEHLSSDDGVGVDVLTPSLEMPESVNILALTVGLG
jgi:hypothetical protein